uniref:Uncharacterized protein n=1 Tax=Oryza sativa subsp. japonica TaxID=39947 RepID=Q6K398_ORYSJ|nr:hypothetical protein [Oryza sativa Japonica Group]
MELGQPGCPVVQLPDSPRRKRGPPTARWGIMVILRGMATCVELCLVSTVVHLWPETENLPSGSCLVKVGFIAAVKDCLVVVEHNVEVSHRQSSLSLNVSRKRWKVGFGRGSGSRRRRRRMELRSEPATAAPAAGKKQRLRQRGCGDSLRGEETPAPAMGKNQRRRRRGCGDNPRGEEALAPATGKNQRLWRRQSTRGRSPERMQRRGGRTCGEEEQASEEEENWRSEVFARGVMSSRVEEEERSIRRIRRGWMDRVVVKSLAQMDVKGNNFYPKEDYHHKFAGTRKSLC